MTHRTSTCLFAFAMVLEVFAPAEVHAQPETDSLAREHYERGVALVEEAEYRDALHQFAAGYELSERPLFLFNMAECARELGEVARARRLYEDYLREDPDGRMRAAAERRLEGLPPAVVGPRETVPSAREAAIQSEFGTSADREVEPIEESRSVVEEWWFWTLIGVVAVATIATVILVATPGQEECETGACIDLR
ncbi:MAG: tetratricopeptide repeat protein [Myxococcota bacterium]